jgi:sugar (pentulose or hexulose) kinase
VARFLGIDLGTTYIKGAVLDPQNGTFTHVSRLPAPEPVAGLPPTRFEIDPNALLATVRALVDGLLCQVPDAGALVMCSQMHCLVFTDELGRPRSNVITWKDQRALEPSPGGRGTLFDELSDFVGPEESAQLGGEMRVGVPISTLFALNRHGSLPGGVYPASLPDFIVANLCGTEPVTDPTLASAHGLYHIGNNDWHRELIARLGFDRLRWPRIVRSGQVVGMADLGGRRLTCHAPIGDQQCALMGAGLGPGELSLNISTGSQVSVLATSGEPSAGNQWPAAPPAPGPPRPQFQTRPYPGGRWLRTFVSVPAGRSLAVLVDLLTEMGRATGQPHPRPWDYIREAIECVSSTDLEVDLSFFASLTGDRGRIANIGEANLTVGHLFLAAFRAMAGNYSRCAATLLPDRGWDRVVFSGGLAQSFERLRCEVLAALGNPPHRVCATEEDTLAGLLELAACDPTGAEAG